MYMKKFKLLVFTLFAVVLNSYYAQKYNTEDNTMLWKISGRDLEKPSYIFGTFHMMCKDNFEIKEKVSTALTETDAYVMEINYNDPNELLGLQKLLVSNKNIDDKFSEAESKSFSEGLKKFGYNLEDVRKYSTIALYSMLITKYFDCPQNELNVYDLKLMELALKQKKEVQGLETAQDQATAFNKFLNKKELLKMMSNYETDKIQMQEMTNMYLKENAGFLHEKMMDTKQMSAEQREVLLDERNMKWIKKMPEMINEKPVFFAVGAGHLFGENGIIALLRNEGYEITPVLD